MSQKEDPRSSNKWREIEEQESEAMADDEHLLPESEDIRPDVTSDKKLEDQLNLLEKQVELYKDQLVRGQAELANVRSRMDQEVSKARKFGVEKLVSDLIPIADSLSRGLEGSTSGDNQVKLMHQGMELTLDMLNKLLEKNGVVAIEPKVGDTFDPTQHEAMSIRQESGAASNTVVQVLQNGYSLHGRVIRAAMVIVAG